MKKFVAGNDIVLQIAVYDQNGAAAPDGPATATVSDGATSTVLSTSIVSGVAEVTVPANLNDLGAATRASRIVTVTAGEISAIDAYVIENPTAAISLTIPKDSAQTVFDALSLAFDLDDIDMWLDAEVEDRVRTLKEAWSRICRLRLTPYRWNDDVTGAASEVVAGEVRLNEITLDQWNLLPEAFKCAAKRAQLIEAESIISGDPVGDRRREGLLSKTVGEASEMFRSGKQLDIPISSRALSELKGYVSFSFRVSR